MTPDLTIVVTPRERISGLSRCLRSLKAAADSDTEFIIINQGYSRRELRRAAKIVRPAPLRVVHDGTFLSEGAARNLGLAAARASAWVLLVDGEVTVAPDTITNLRNAADVTGAAVVTPLILERPGVIHSAGGDLVFPDSPTGEITHTGDYMHQECSRQFRMATAEVPMVETHILLVDRSVVGVEPFSADHMHPFHFDFALTCQKEGWPCVRAPEARAMFHQPPPLSWGDWAFYSQRWNRIRFQDDAERFAAKWGYTGQGANMEEFEEFALNMSVFPARFRNPATQPISNAVWRARKTLGGMRRAWRFRHEGGRLTV